MPIVEPGRKAPTFAPPDQVDGHAADVLRAVDEF